MLLPIEKKEKEILDAIENNDVCIITAETGAGKSTKVPQMLFKLGYNVVVTQPRRIAARTVAERVAEEIGEELGKTVGFKTGFEALASADTKILFCTDGLQLIKEICSKTDKNEKSVLIIDEVHEWNLNIEALIAWANKRIGEGWKTKLVIMTATLESDFQLSNFFNTSKVASVKVPGRLFPVHERIGKEFITDICDLIDEGRNILVFMPGKAEIGDVILKLSAQQKECVILPLHGELGMNEQKKCFEVYDVPKVVVATNVAQTSITIPDIDAVVDSGLEKIMVTNNGVEGIVIKECSKADLLQRKGRAGRTKEGVYILDPAAKPYANRPQFSQPEIKRLNLDQIVLRFEAVGIDPANISFYHQPEIESINTAKELLTSIGAIGKDGKITSLGKRMAEMPISARYARMILEAEKNGVVNDVIIIVAILEIGSMVNFKEVNYRRFHIGTSESDLLAELQIYKKFETNKAINFKKEGIIAKRFFRIKELIAKIKRALSGKITFSDSHDTEAILKSCFSGMLDNIYMYEMGSYVSVKNTCESRYIDKNSILYGKYSDYVIGIPHDIQFEKWGSLNKIHIISMVSLISVDFLLRNYPEAFEVERGIEPYYDPGYGVCFSFTEYYYYGRRIKKIRERDDNNPLAQQLKAEYEEELLAAIDNKKKIEPVVQKLVYVSGYEYVVEYSWKGEANIYVTPEELDKISEKCVKLKNGKAVNINCNSCRANNFPALKKMVKEANNKRLYRALIETLPALRTDKFDKIKEEMFPELGKRTINGEEVFVHLELQNNLIGLNVEENAEIANSENKKALSFIFDKEVKIKYPDFNFYERISTRKINTTKAKKAKEEFDEFVEEIKENLTLDNLFESIEFLEKIFEDVTCGYKR